MNLVINGEKRDLGPGITNVGLLIGALSVKKERTAVELNGTIIDQSKWDSTELSSGDKIEIVSFVGGG